MVRDPELRSYLTIQDDALVLPFRGGQDISGISSISLSIRLAVGDPEPRSCLTIQDDVRYPRNDSRYLCHLDLNSEVFYPP